MAVTIGLAGAGRRATEVYAPTLASCPDVTFAGVWSRSGDHARQLASQFGVPAFDHYDNFLANCDAVAVAQPPAAQVEYASIAARRGKSVLLARPMAVDVAGAEELSSAVSEGKVVSQLALTWRYASAVRRFLHTEAPPKRPVGGAARLVAGLRMTSGVSSAQRTVLHHHGFDVLDLLQAALGKIVAVKAHGDPEGWLGLMMDHDQARFSESSLYAVEAAEPDRPDATPQRADVEVFGPGGTARVDCVAAVGPLTYETMFREFAEAVRSGQSPRYNAEHGLQLHKIIEAAETGIVIGA